MISKPNPGRIASIFYSKWDMVSSFASSEIVQYLNSVVMLDLEMFFFGKFLLCTAKLSWKNIVIVVYFRRSTAIWTKLQTWFPKYRIFLCKRSPINLGGVFQAGHSVNRILSPTFGWLGLEPTHQRTILQFYKLKSISNMGKLRLRHFEVIIWPEDNRTSPLPVCFCVSLVTKIIPILGKLYLIFLLLPLSW